MSERDPDRDYLEINRANWDSRVPLHLEGYDLDRLRMDASEISRVVEFDLPLLGEVRGLRGVHFQCHIGSDTVSLARLGAEMAGVDLSPASLAAARSLAAELGLAIPFIESDVYAAPSALVDAGVELGFDFVYTGVGALCWLPKVEPWAKAAAEVLRPGGFLFIRDAHPMMMTIEEARGDGLLVVAYDYFEGPGLYLEEEQTYAGEGKVSSPGNVTFNHSFAEIFKALSGNGLDIELFEEHQTAPWNAFGDVEELIPGTDEWQLRQRPRRMPKTFSLRAVKR